MFSTGLAEIVFTVNDVSAAARFYRDVVGLIPLSGAEDECLHTQWVMNNPGWDRGNG